MNILLLTLGNYAGPDRRTIYHDLMREFIADGHSVYVACPAQPSDGGQKGLIPVDGAAVCKIGAGALTKTGPVAKGISTLLLPYRFKRAIGRRLADVRFDLVLYSTPPVTFADVVAFVKKRDGASAYLLCKDIFPQNAVDLHLLRQRGLLRPVYQYFKKKERQLYSLSDYIGCMSEANARYLLDHNDFLKPSRVEVCPNTMTVTPFRARRKSPVRRSLCIPEKPVVFLLGGNLGLPQGIDFLIRALTLNIDKPDRFFVICGAGTEYPKLLSFFESARPGNMRLINGEPRRSFDRLARCCDVGLVTLDHRFTVPNFPSRILSYMECGLPVLAATDPCTDLRETIAEGGFGWWCESSDEQAFTALVDAICASPREIRLRGARAREYMENNYNSHKAYRIIMEHFSDREA